MREVFVDHYAIIDAMNLTRIVYRIEHLLLTGSCWPINESEKYIKLIHSFEIHTTYTGVL